jgi:hypothetical chaperone protein
MSSPIAYGIDFGTSNSAIAIAYKTKVSDLGLLTSQGVPSIIYLDDIGMSLVGDDAVEQFLIRGGWPNARLMSSLKTFLADELFTHTESWGRRWELEDLIAIIIRELKRRADEATGADVRRVVIGYPVAFPGADGPRFGELQELALGRLVAAAHRAGFDEVELLDEPTAALSHGDIKTGTMIALDFGGGTFDVSVMRFKRGGAEVLSTQGVAVGGELFDGYTFDLALHRRLGLNRVLTGDRLRDVRTMQGLLTIASDHRTLSQLVNLVQESKRSPLRLLKRILDGGHAYALCRAVEAAKIELSSKDEAEVVLRRPESGVGIAQPVSREDFEASIDQDLDLVIAQIDRALEDAQLTPREVDEVLLTGGSCMIPAFRRRLRQRFLARQLKERDVFSRVATGLAHHARKLWR